MTKNVVLFWLKFYWKWVQGSLVLSTPQQKDKPHKSVRWPALKLDMSAIMQLQIMPAMCVCSANEKWMTTKFMYPLYKIMLFSYLPYKDKLLHHRSITTQEGTYFEKCKSSAFGFMYTIFCFISGIYQLFLFCFEKVDFIVINNITDFGNICSCIYF
jgi:hypothetical protein